MYAKIMYMSILIKMKHDLKGHWRSYKTSSILYRGCLIFVFTFSHILWPNYNHYLCVQGKLLSLIFVKLVTIPGSWLWWDLWGHLRHTRNISIPLNILIYFYFLKFPILIFLVSYAPIALQGKINVFQMK